MTGPEEFTTAVLRWFAQHGRELPWRGIGDPYGIWVSEVILQQTRIDQGTDYWYRFMERFPTVEALAAASEDEVLRQWQGLGYYSRARNMHAASRQIVEQGGFPKTIEGLRSLKGVGDYIAAAVGSIAFGLPAAAVDGNIGSRWESQHIDPQTWIVDLGESMTFNAVRIVWEGAYGTTFDILVGDEVDADGYLTDGEAVVSIEGQTLTGFILLRFSRKGLRRAGGALRFPRAARRDALVSGSCFIGAFLRPGNIFGYHMHWQTVRAMACSQLRWYRGCARFFQKQSSFPFRWRQWSGKMNCCSLRHGLPFQGWRLLLGGKKSVGRCSLSGRMCTIGPGSSLTCLQG